MADLYRISWRRKRDNALFTHTDKKQEIIDRVHYLVRDEKYKPEEITVERVVYKPIETALILLSPPSES